MSAGAAMDGAKKGLPIAATYVAGVAIGHAWAGGGEDDEPDLDIDIALPNTNNYPEFQALMVEWYDSTLSREERIRLARSLVRLMQHYGTSNLVARTALTPQMAHALHQWASGHGYGT